MRSIPEPFSVLGLCLLLGLAPMPAEGQLSPFQMELRAGATAPVQGLADPNRGWSGDTGPGAAFGVSFAYNLSWYAAGYGGFSQLRFSCPARGCGFDTRLVATGFDLGLRFILGTGPVVPWIRTGLLFYRVEGSVPGEDGPRAVTSSRAGGGELGFGVTLRLTDRLTLAPGLRYARMTPDFRGVGRLPMRYLLADVGLVIGF